jgi:hypothetical protein
MRPFRRQLRMGRVTASALVVALAAADGFAYMSIKALVSA